MPNVSAQPDSSSKEYPPSPANDGELCKVCRNPINKDAIKCVICGSYQSRLRRFLADIDIQALIALIPITVLAWTFMKDQLIIPTADLRLAVLSCSGDTIKVAAANIGNRDALFAGAFLVRGSEKPIPLNLDMQSNEPLISPSTTRIYDLAAIDLSGARMGLQLSTKRPCEYQLQPRSVSLMSAVETSAKICACPLDQ